MLVTVRHLIFLVSLIQRSSNWGLILLIAQVFKEPKQAYELVTDNFI